VRAQKICGNDRLGHVIDVSYDMKALPDG